MNLILEPAEQAVIVPDGPLQRKFAIRCAPNPFRSDHQARAIFDKQMKRAFSVEAHLETLIAQVAFAKS